jgi:hypothetical protein
MSAWLFLAPLLHYASIESIGSAQIVFSVADAPFVVYQPVS